MWRLRHHAGPQRWDQGAYTGLSFKGQFFFKKRKHLVFHQINQTLAYLHCKPPEVSSRGSFSGTLSRASPSCFSYFIPNLKIGAAGAVLGLSLDVAIRLPRILLPRIQGFRAPSGAPLSGSKTDGSAPVRKLLPAPLPGRCCFICLSFQTPPFLLWLLTRGSREKSGIGGHLGFGGLFFSIFHCLLVPQCQGKSQSWAQEVNSSMCQFINTIWLLTSRSAYV